MNRQRQNEAMARIEEYEVTGHKNGHVIVMREDMIASNIAPDYDDMNVLHRIVCGMDENTHEKYTFELCRLMAGTDEKSFFVNAYAPREAVELLIRATKATPKQIREALLKAHGKWDENEEENND